MNREENSNCRSIPYNEYFMLWSRSGGFMLFFPYSPVGLSSTDVLRPRTGTQTTEPATGKRSLTIKRFDGAFR